MDDVGAQAAQKADQACEERGHVPAAGLAETREPDAWHLFDRAPEHPAWIEGEHRHLEARLVEALDQLGKLTLGAAAVEQPNEKAESNAPAHQDGSPRVGALPSEGSPGSSRRL